MAVTRAPRTHAGDGGVAFSTSERRGTPGEKALQEIQQTLAGKVFIALQEPIAHLFLEASQAVDPVTKQTVAGPSTVALWVPADQESRAASLLSTAGFVLD